MSSGPYANAILRFHIDFPDDFPQNAPVLVFQSEVFHPLITPLTTHTYSARTLEADTVSAADQQRLPPGGLSLRHGFPEWFSSLPFEAPIKAESLRPDDFPNKSGSTAPEGLHASTTPQYADPPHIVEVLQYLRIIFDTEEVLDSVPLHAAAHAGAWHAWRSYRAKVLGVNTLSTLHAAPNDGAISRERSTSPRQQPGGAKRPGEWNWQGVWEDRVRKSVQASISDPVLFGGDSNDVVLLPQCPLP